MKKNNQWFFILLKLLITLALLLWLYSKVDFNHLVKVLASSNVTFLMLAFAFHVLGFVLGSYRWWWLLCETGVEVKHHSILPSYYIGLFFNNVLPSGVGGDAVRIYRLYCFGISAKALTASSIMDRAIGIIVILLIGALALIYSDLFQLPVDENYTVILIISFITILSIILFLPLWNEPLKKWQEKYQHLTFFRVLLDILILCHSYHGSKNLLFRTVLITFFLHICIVLCYFFIGMSINIGVSFMSFMLIVPVVFVVSNLPISFGGLGVRESVLVSLLMLLGVNEQESIAFSLIYLLVLWAITFPAILLLLEKNKSK